jgi:hypothetical protein
MKADYTTLLWLVGTWKLIMSQSHQCSNQASISPYSDSTLGLNHQGVPTFLVAETIE